MSTRKFRPSRHQRRMEAFARRPKSRPRWPRMGEDFFWTAEQRRAEDKIFLMKKWTHDNGDITAYGVNMRLWARSMNKGSRTPKGEVK